MGWLDHSTNNIIVDAVLTDIGRQFLSQNDGSFSIVKFAASDDEVDYSMIKKFGRTVGKEKVEKNTPVFEALTNGTIAQKYRCVSVSNPYLVRLPSLSLTGDNLSSNIVSMGKLTTKTSSITVSQDISNENTIDVELRDQVFLIEVNNLFLQIQGYTPDNIDNLHKATYSLIRDATETAKGGSKLTFTLQVKNISDSLFTTYGSTQNKSFIKTYVKISGLHSGAVKEFEIQISKTG
jgi:flagellar biogenesis protein FliO